jgi:hypothetical protein
MCRALNPSPGGLKRHLWQDVAFTRTSCLVVPQEFEMLKNRARLFAVLAAFLALVICKDAAAADFADFRSWMVTRMLAWSPPGRSLLPAAKETREEGANRYGEIADAIIVVAFDPAETPLFPGRRGRVRTAALMAAVALHESGYRKDVDLNIGGQARGDGGKSWCMAQVNLGVPGPNGKTLNRIVLTKDGYEFTHDPNRGFGGEDLIADRRNCFRVGLHVMRTSFNTCKVPVLEKLAMYASGNCNDGRDASRLRVGKAVKWLSEYPPPLDDPAIKAFLSAQPPAAPVPPANPPLVPVPDGSPGVTALRTRMSTE